MRIFVSYSLENISCFSQVKWELEQHGYEVVNGEIEETRIVRTKSRNLDSLLRSSIAILVIWSKDAKLSKKIAGQINYGLKLHKPLLLISTDDTEFTDFISPIYFSIASEVCEDAMNQVASQLMLLSTDGIRVKIFELLNQDPIAKRKEGVIIAGTLLSNEIYCAEMLALLEDVSKNDKYSIIRKSAAEIISAYEANKSLLASEVGSQPDYIVSIRCFNCQSVNEYDKRIICQESTRLIHRTVLVEDDSTKMEEIYLLCKSCKEPIIAKVDCGSYK